MAKKAVKPTKELFKNIGRVLVLFWRVDKKLFILTIFFTILAALFPIIVAYISKFVLDEIVTVQDQAGVITAALLGFFSFRYVLSLFEEFTYIFLYEYLERISRFKMENHLTYEFTKKLSGLDIAHFDNPEIQSLIQKAKQNYTWRITNFVNENLPGILYAVAGLIGAFLVLIPFGFWIPIAIILATTPRLILRKKLTRVQWSVFEQNIPESKELEYLKGQLEDHGALKEIKIFQASPALLKKLQKLQNFIFENTKKPLKKYISWSYFPVLIETVVIALVAYYKLSSVVEGVLTIGSFVFFISLLDRISNSSHQFVSSSGRMYENNLYIGYYFDVLNLPRLIKERDPGHEFEEIKPPKIEFQNVSFNYLDGPKVLKNISFTLNPKEHLAIVGPNGAGKTTLVKMLLRFYDPSQGNILINDFDLKEIKLNNWYKFISILFQDFTKFWLTVKENILLGNTRLIDEGKMRQAAEKSGANDFIERFPKKYDQRLGRIFDESTELSIGQWQKLALARAFYEEAPVLILDEPTSAIDAEAEEKIFENLYKVYENKSLILVSHRFSTVKNAHKRIVLKNGKIAEEGNHESLIKKDGIYATMFRKQAKGYVE